MRWLGLLARRILVVIPVILGAFLLTFLLLRVGSNNPVGMLAGPTASAEEIATIQASLHLDQPVFFQFGAFVWAVLHGDLGRSWLDDKPVFNELLTRLPATL